MRRIDHAGRTISQIDITYRDLEAVSYCCGLMDGPLRDDGMAQVERGQMFGLRNRIRMSLDRAEKDRQ